ncbi:hypothetical protein BVC80_1431g49 [Macleaya cordata]|uniref:Secreted protein n=1 Tax=Macleaya cordata TaxID=56857 RepID=A0A200PZT9_MACCD|nr:hypothetical protein BVC80_1431g49 [Macleaya cordata]
MNVVNLVILLVNVAYVSVHEAWEVEDVEVPVLDAARVQHTGAGVPAPTRGDRLHDVVAYHHPADAATAGHHHIAMLVIRLMQMEINLGAEAEADSRHTN